MKARIADLVRERPWIARLVLALSALVTALCLVFPNVLGIIEWFSIIPAAVVFLCYATDEKIRLRRAYFDGGVFFLVFFLICYSWFLSMHPLDFTGLDDGESVAVVLLAWIGMSLVGAAIFSLIPLITRIIARGKKGALADQHPTVIAIVLSSLWAIAEWGMTFTWIGFPWARLNIGQVDLIITAQSASLLGPYFLTFIIALVNSLAAAAIICPDSKKRLLSLSAFILAANISIGGILCLTTAEASENGEKIKVAAVQGNVSTKDGWDQLLSNTVSVERHKKYSILAAEEGATLILWPETAYPYSLAEGSPLKVQISDIADNVNASIFVGSQLFEIDGDEVKYYNSVVVVDGDGKYSEDAYKKQNLVPFGEYLPCRELFMKLLPSLGEISLLEFDLSPGDDSVVLDADGCRVGVLICFDSIYETSALDSIRNGAEIILLPTNDSWFEGSPAGYMHLSHARMRAIEQGRYVVRSANTGISAVISPSGRIISSIPELTEGYLVEEVSLLNTRTLYSYVGNIAVYLMVAFVVSTLIIGYVDLKKKK